MTMVLARKRPDAPTQFFDVRTSEQPEAWIAQDRFGPVAVGLGRDRNEAARLVLEQSENSRPPARKARAHA